MLKRLFFFSFLPLSSPFCSFNYSLHVHYLLYLQSPKHHFPLLTACRSFTLFFIFFVLKDQIAYVSKSELALENLENVKVVCMKLYDYVRYDLKEIAFPPSLPDPPYIKKCHRLTRHERFLVLKEASRFYTASWVRDIGPDLRPNDYKKDDEIKEPSTLEDIGEEHYFMSYILHFHWHIFGESLLHQAKIQLLRKILNYYLSSSSLSYLGQISLISPFSFSYFPGIIRLYMTRASVYRDALKSFIEGYQESIQQIWRKRNILLKHIFNMLELGEM
ncbi:hypothetical protein CXB51_001728 [Gossypium anomalum]|uniref:Uncharacterized protein n=1 Tax=Gossypium anomalum TaxID=47600 RepID=A0A8J5ZM18_9ROSI|nr:hypothetical protein CXB51_001728 [Gossypium anomalum]